jgi:hypothetical protein
MRRVGHGYGHEMDYGLDYGSLWIACHRHMTKMDMTRMKKYLRLCSRAESVRLLHRVFIVQDLITNPMKKEQTTRKNKCKYVSSLFFHVPRIHIFNLVRNGEDHCTLCATCLSFFI